MSAASSAACSSPLRRGYECWRASCRDQPALRTRPIGPDQAMHGSRRKSESWPMRMPKPRQTRKQRKFWPHSPAQAKARAQFADRRQAIPSGANGDDRRRFRQSRLPRLSTIPYPRQSYTCLEYSPRRHYEDYQARDVTVSSADKPIDLGAIELVPSTQRTGDLVPFPVRT